jgi:hypothetical protein
MRGKNLSKTRLAQSAALRRAESQSLKTAELRSVPAPVFKAVDDARLISVYTVICSRGTPGKP